MTETRKSDVCSKEKPPHMDSQSRLGIFQASIVVERVMGKAFSAGFVELNNIITGTP